MNWNEKTPPNSLKSSAAQEETQETEKSCAAGESAPTGAKSRNRPQRFRLRCFRQNVSQLPLLYIKWESFAITMISVNHLSKVRTEKKRRRTAWKVRRREEKTEEAAATFCRRNSPWRLKCSETGFDPKESVCVSPPCFSVGETISEMRTILNN